MVGIPELIALALILGVPTAVAVLTFRLIRRSLAPRDMLRIDAEPQDRLPDT